MKNLFLFLALTFGIFTMNSCSKDDIIDNQKLYTIDVLQTCLGDTADISNIFPDIYNEEYQMINQNSFKNDGDILTFDKNFSVILTSAQGGVGNGIVFYTSSNTTSGKITYEVNGDSNYGNIKLYFHDFNGSGDPKTVWGTYYSN